MTMHRRDVVRYATSAAALLAVPRPLRALLETARGPWLDAALRAAAWLRSTRIETDSGLAWAWNPEESPDEIDRSLYTGMPGVILFHLELYHATGERAHLEEAARGADDLIAVLPAEAERHGAGLYTGVAGWAFVLDEVHRATGATRHREGADRGLAFIHAAARPAGAGIAWNDSADIISGSAGIGLLLLRAGDARSIELAIGAGRRLIELGEPAEGGLDWELSPSVPRRYPNFSHGTAGVAYFLAALHERTGEAAFLDAARAGATYLMAAATRNDGCRVFHHRPGGEDLYYLSWCHGPAGTARLFHRLERITGHRVFGEAAACFARGLVESGAPEERSAGYWNNVSQCCGDAGVGEYFLARARAFGRAEDRAMAARAGEALLARATEDAPTVGLKWVQAEHRVRPAWTVPQTGFMQGAAGIGTFLLHLDALDRGSPPPIRWPDSPWA